MLLFFLLTSDPEIVSSGSPHTTPARSGRSRPYPVFTVAFRRDNTPYVVFRPLPGTRAVHTSKRRFAYSVCVVHFRKLWN